MSFDSRGFVLALARELQDLHAAADALANAGALDGASLAHHLGVAGLLPNALASRRFLDALAVRGVDAREALLRAYRDGATWVRAPASGTYGRHHGYEAHIPGSLRELGRHTALPPGWRDDYREHLDDWQDYLDDIGDSPDYDDVVNAFAAVAERLRLGDDHPVRVAGTRLPTISDAALAAIAHTHESARFSLMERLRSRLPADLDRALDGGDARPVATVAYAYSGGPRALPIGDDLWLELTPEGATALIWSGDASAAPTVSDAQGHALPAVPSEDSLVRWPMERGTTVSAGDLLVDLDFRTVVRMPRVERERVARARADAAVGARLLVVHGTDASTLAHACLGMPADEVVLLAPSEEVARAAAFAVAKGLRDLRVSASVETDVAADPEAVVLRAEAAVARCGDIRPADVVLEVGGTDVETSALLGGLAGVRGYRLSISDPECAVPPRTHLSPRHLVPEDPRPLAYALFAGGALPEAMDALDHAVEAGFADGALLGLREVGAYLLARAVDEETELDPVLDAVPSRLRSEVGTVLRALGPRPDREAVMEAAARVATVWQPLSGVS